MSEWQPDVRALSDILQYLKQSAYRPDSDVMQRLEEFSNNPECNLYLFYILTQMPQEDDYIRNVAGLALKNNINRINMPGNVFDHIKQNCWQYAGDKKVGKTVSQVITAIVKLDLSSNVFMSLQALMGKVEDQDPFVAENAFYALQMVCEDRIRILSENGSFLDYLVPFLINFIEHPSPKMRLYAIMSMTHLVQIQPPSLMSRMDDFMTKLFKNATSNSIDVQKVACQAIVTLVDANPDAVIPYLPTLGQFMLSATQSEDADLALEACEFWQSFANQSEEHVEQLRPYLPYLVPALLKGMVYSEMDLHILGGMEDDADVADSSQDIKPRFHKANVVEVDRIDEQSPDEKKGDKNTGNPQEEDDEDDEDEDDEDDDEFDGEWNLRKCSAATLDILTTAFEGEIVAIIMPLLAKELQSPDWLHRECGILALGAIAEGGMDYVAQHLDELVPFLFQNLKDPKCLVRSITCWTLSRYSTWVADRLRTDPAAHEKYLQPLVFGLLERILDNNKRVQEAACSSFLILEEETTTDIIPYLQPILTTLHTAFAKFQRRNMLLLFEALGTLAEVVGPALNTPQFIELIIPPLIAKWKEIPDEGDDIFALFECLTSVATALGRSFTPYAEPLFKRCLNMICQMLEQAHTAPLGEEENEVIDVIIVALDLMSSIVQALNTDADPLVGNSIQVIVSILSVGVRNEMPEIRQSSFALIGELAVSTIGHLKGVLPEFMPFIISQIDGENHSAVANNATWAAGEIAIKWTDGITPFVEPLLQKLFPLIGSVHQRALLENVAVTIGRLGIVCPAMIAPHLQNFIEPWLTAMIPIANNEEKSSAFSGLCELIKANHNGAINHLPLLLTAIAKYPSPPATLRNTFKEILEGYKHVLGVDGLREKLALVEPRVQEILVKDYEFTL